MEPAKTPSKAKAIVSRVAGIVTIPLLAVIAVLIVCAVSGKQLFGTAESFYGFTRYAAVVLITTIALSINLSCGRFDFSLGSIAVLSSVVSGKITYGMLSGSCASAPVMLLMSILVGAALGAFSGGLYVLLKLPPIITSLGVALIFEGIVFSITGGSSVKHEIDNASMTFFRSSWWIHLLLILLVVVVVYLVFDRSSFGYRYKALRAGQKISINTGIKEVSNAVVCYAICGGLMGIVGFLQALPGNVIQTSVLNFGSISIMFTAFLPMFVGGFIGRFCNEKIGYTIAAFTMSLISSMFALFSEKSITPSIQSIVVALMLVFILIFLNNEQTCRDLVSGALFRRWVASIKAKKEKTEAKE